MPGRRPRRARAAGGGRAALALTAVLAACDAAAAHHYRATLSEDFRSLAVRACFEAPVPAVLRAARDDARRYLRAPQPIDNPRAKLRLVGRELRLDGFEPGQCLRYRVDLSVRDGQRRAPVAQVGEDLRVDPRICLWRPAGATTPIELSFELPAGIAVSAPWQSAGARRFSLGPRPAAWSAALAFGKLERFAVRVPGAILDVAVLDGRPPAPSEGMRRWVREAALAVVGAYGRFPVPRVQVLIVPVDDWGRNEAVPFGHVLRGGGPAIEFFVNTRRPLEEYLSDWTAVHELSHLLHPLLVSEDAWLSEGLASYYQNILRARSGALSRQAAWQKLHEGFQRGIDGTRGLPLVRATANMHRDRAYMRVYWSGAAVALMADVRLRAAGRGSLDEALARFADCCLPAERRWQGGAFMDKLDELMGTEVFSELYARHARSERFPDLGGTYRRLGLRTDGGRLRLVDAGDADIRERITHSHSSSL